MYGQWKYFFNFPLDIKKYRCYITNRTDGIIIKIRHIGFSDMLDRIEKY